MHLIQQKAGYMSEKKTAVAIEESRGPRYAVIGVGWNEVFPELVIAYRDEESLRQLVAAPSIIAIGFSSREAASAELPRNSSSEARAKSFRERLASGCADDHSAPHTPKQYLRRSLGIKEILRIAGTTLQHAVAVGIVLFYSKGIMGATLRACVGS